MIQCVEYPGLKKMSSLSPGGVAVGYNYLNVVTRILMEKKPQIILDMGLGVSSTLISSYITEQKDAVHYITEHDKKWIEFYKKEHTLIERDIILFERIGRKAI